MKPQVSDTWLLEGSRALSINADQPQEQVETSLLQPRKICTQLHIKQNRSVEKERPGSHAVNCAHSCKSQRQELTHGRSRKPQRLLSVLCYWLLLLALTYLSDLQPFYTLMKDVPYQILLSAMFFPGN